ncbi:MAG: sugar phosphate isomerase/epimerase [Anaerolineae bacterium]|nr:sugar phosphate isomerase/epimerase [Anaerolineae bacterium]
MQIACHLWAYNDQPLEDALGTIARLGFRYVDLGSGPHLDLETAALYPGREARRLRALLDYYELGLTDLYLMLPYINDPDPAQRVAQLALFERLIPFALALGAPGLTVSPGVENADAPDEALARSVPALMEMVRIAEDTDLRISFEPHMDSAVTSPDSALLLLRAVPGLSLTLDYAHFIVQGYRLEDLQAVLPHVGHVHVRQAVKGRLQTPFRQGRLDLEKMMDALVAAGYFSTFTVEYMTTIGWHGMMAVNITQESMLMRDALRKLRASLRHAP